MCEKKGRYEREVAQLDDRNRRTKEFDTLLEESKISLLRCHKCPIWSLCPHQHVELSMELLRTEERRHQPYLPFAIPSQDRINKFRDGLKIMETVKESCPLLQGFVRRATVTPR